jgi:hydroxypyruvate reductase
MGYETVFLTDLLSCEARETGRFLAAILRSHAGSGRKLAFLAGGETVVHLTGKGRGGRNQEIALGAAELLSGLPACVISIGSDGTDGPTDAAGGYCDGDTLRELEGKGINLSEVLKENDAYHALKAIDGLIFTGPTGTNVNDVSIGLIWPEAAKKG